MSPETYTPLTMEQIEAAVEEVIEANAVWPDPLPSQRDAVMDVLREAMAQAWDEGHDECCAVYVRHCATAANPYTGDPTQPAANQEPGA